ncbi:flagellar associated protein [Scenedesmus sp. NREL 46B-D3]|nr:flagellar associated protein [Scenedesmus sp. NREL 46B-D3]
MAPTQPTLPKKKAQAKKAAPTGKELPIAFAQHITLQDGTQVPVKIPPGMPAEQAQGIMAYLQANPEAAKAAWAQAQSLLATPGLANAFVNMQSQADPTHSAAVYEALKDDAELAPVFEDVKANGPGALQKYWEDTALMSKISAKLRDMKLAGGQQQQQGGAKPSKAPASADIASLHEAAKWGDLEAARRLLDGGADVNGLNERGISALGVAVGFNRLPFVELLLDAGADLALRDSQDNTVLHYAAGYGRLDLTRLLLERGAELEAVNGKQQKPADVARLNGEKEIAAFLQQQAGDEEAEEKPQQASS